MLCPLVLRYRAIVCLLVVMVRVATALGVALQKTAVWISITSFSLFVLPLVIEHEIFKMVLFYLFFCQWLRSTCISTPAAYWWQWSGSKGITLVNTQCWADLTGHSKSPPPRGGESQKREQCRCVLVTLHVTVQWWALGQSGQQSLDWLSRPVQFTGAIWCQEDTWGGWLSGPKGPFWSSPLFYIALSHIHRGAVCQIHFRLPVNLINPDMLPTTSPLLFLLTLPLQMSYESAMQQEWESSIVFQQVSNVYIKKGFSRYCCRLERLW